MNADRPSPKPNSAPTVVGEKNSEPTTADSPPKPLVPMSDEDEGYVVEIPFTD